MSTKYHPLTEWALEQQKKWKGLKETDKEALEILKEYNKRIGTKFNPSDHWSAITIENARMAANGFKSVEEAKKAGVNLSHKSHSGYVNDGFKAVQDPNYKYNKYISERIDDSEIKIGDYLVGGRESTKNWKFEDFEKAAKNNSGYESHGSAVVFKGIDNNGEYVILADGNWSDTYANRKVYVKDLARKGYAVKVTDTNPTSNSQVEQSSTRRSPLDISLERSENVEDTDEVVEDTEDTEDTEDDSVLDEGPTIEEQLQYATSSGSSNQFRLSDEAQMQLFGTIVYPRNAEGASIISPEGDPWEYKKEGNDFYTKKKEDEEWIPTDGAVSNNIKENIFNEPCADGNCKDEEYSETNPFENLQAEYAEKEKEEPWWKTAGYSHSQSRVIDEAYMNYLDGDLSLEDFNKIKERDIKSRSYTKDPYIAYLDGDMSTEDYKKHLRTTPQFRSDFDKVVSQLDGFEERNGQAYKNSVGGTSYKLTADQKKYRRKIATDFAKKYGYSIESFPTEQQMTDDESLNLIDDGLLNMKGNLLREDLKTYDSKWKRVHELKSGFEKAGYQVDGDYNIRWDGYAEGNINDIIDTEKETHSLWDFEANDGKGDFIFDGSLKGTAYYANEDCKKLGKVFDVKTGVCVDDPYGFEMIQNAAYLEPEYETDVTGRYAVQNPNRPWGGYKSYMETYGHMPQGTGSSDQFWLATLLGPSSIPGIVGSLTAETAITPFIDPAVDFVFDMSELVVPGNPVKQVSAFTKYAAPIEKNWNAAVRRYNKADGFFDSIGAFFNLEEGGPVGALPMIMHGGVPHEDPPEKITYEQRYQQLKKAWEEEQKRANLVMENAHKLAYELGTNENEKSSDALDKQAKGYVYNFNDDAQKYILEPRTIEVRNAEDWDRIGMSFINDPMHWVNNLTRKDKKGNTSHLIDWDNSERYYDDEGNRELTYARDENGNLIPMRRRGEGCIGAMCGVYSTAGATNISDYKIGYGNQIAKAGDPIFKQMSNIFWDANNEAALRAAGFEKVKEGDPIKKGTLARVVKIDENGNPYHSHTVMVNKVNEDGTGIDYNDPEAMIENPGPFYRGIVTNKPYSGYKFDYYNYVGDTKRLKEEFNAFEPEYNKYLERKEDIGISMPIIKPQLVMPESSEIPEIITREEDQPKRKKLFSKKIKRKHGGPHDPPSGRSRTSQDGDPPNNPYEFGLYINERLGKAFDMMNENPDAKYTGWYLDNYKAQDSKYTLQGKERADDPYSGFMSDLMDYDEENLKAYIDLYKAYIKEDQKSIDTGEEGKYTRSNLDGYTQIVSVLEDVLKNPIKPKSVVLGAELAPIIIYDKPTYKDAYKNVDKDKYPTYEDFEFAAKYYNETGTNPDSQDLPSNRLPAPPPPEYQIEDIEPDISPLPIIEPSLISRSDTGEIITPEEEIQYKRKFGFYDKEGESKRAKLRNFLGYRIPELINPKKSRSIKYKTPKGFGFYEEPIQEQMYPEGFVPRFKDGGPHDPLPAEYLKSEGFAKAANQDLDSLLRGFNTDGYDSHWYEGGTENYGVTSDQLRAFAGDYHPKSFVNAAAYSQAMNKLANDAGGKNVINIPFADNPMVMRTADDDVEYVEYVKPTTLQEEGYMDETGTNAVNQYQSRGLAKRYTQFEHGGPHEGDPPDYFELLEAYNKAREEKAKYDKQYALDLKDYEKNKVNAKAKYDEDLRRYNYKWDNYRDNKAYIEYLSNKFDYLPKSFDDPMLDNLEPSEWNSEDSRNFKGHRSVRNKDGKEFAHMIDETLWKKMPGFSNFFTDPDHYLERSLILWDDASMKDYANRKLNNVITTDTKLYAPPSDHPEWNKFYRKFGFADSGKNTIELYGKPTQKKPSLDLEEPEYNPPVIPEKPEYQPTKLDVIKPELISYDTELPDIIERDEVEGVDYKRKFGVWLEDKADKKARLKTFFKYAVPEFFNPKKSRVSQYYRTPKRLRAGFYNEPIEDEQIYPEGFAAGGYVLEELVDGGEDDIIRPHGDPYEYKKVGDKYYTRRREGEWESEEQPGWDLATGAAEDAIKYKVFKETRPVPVVETTIDERFPLMTYDPNDPNDFYARYYNERNIDQSQDALKPEYFNSNYRIDVNSNDDEYEQWKAQTFKPGRRAPSWLEKNVFKPIGKEIDKFQKTDFGPIGDMTEFAYDMVVDPVVTLASDFYNEPNQTATEVMQMMADGFTLPVDAAAETIRTNIIEPEEEFNTSTLGSSTSIERAGQLLAITPWVPPVAKVVTKGGKTAKVVNAVDGAADDVVNVSNKKVISRPGTKKNFEAAPAGSSKPTMSAEEIQAIESSPYMKNQTQYPSIAERDYNRLVKQNPNHPMVKKVESGEIKLLKMNDPANPHSGFKLSDENFASIDNQVKLKLDRSKSVEGRKRIFEQEKAYIKEQYPEMSDNLINDAAEQATKARIAELEDLYITKNYDLKWTGNNELMNAYHSPGQAVRDVTNQNPIGVSNFEKTVTPVNRGQRIEFHPGNVDDAATIQHELGHGYSAGRDLPIEKEILDLMEDASSKLNAKDKRAYNYLVKDNAKKNDLIKRMREHDPANKNLTDAELIDKYSKYGQSKQPLGKEDWTFSNEIESLMGGSSEAIPYAQELKQVLLDQGLIDDWFQEVTPSMLAKSNALNKAQPRGLYFADMTGQMTDDLVVATNTRLLDLTNPAKYGDLAKILNKVAPVASVPIAAGTMLDNN